MEHLKEATKRRSDEATERGLGRAVIVAGMPRSGKAIVAQALGRAGVHLGDDLKGPTRHNPEGYFEDLGVIALHDELLERVGATWNRAETLDDLDVPDALRDRVREQITARYAGRGTWGWKDPRTTLFLDMWDGIVPDARWLLVVRSPAEVAAALLDRGDLKAYAPTAVGQARLALRLWESYNRRLLAFADREPDRTLLIVTPDDLEPGPAGIVDRIVRERWQLDLRPLQLCRIYVPALMTRRVPPWLRAFAATHRPSASLFGRLVRLRDRRWINHVGERVVAAGRYQDADAASRPPVVALVAPQEFAYSETFVRDHVRWMPARVRVLYAGAPRAATAGVVPGWLDKLRHAWNFPNRSADGRRLIGPVRRLVDLAWQHGLERDGHPCGERAFRRYLRREGVQAVFAEFGQTGTWVMRACAAEDVPLIVQFHGSEAYRQRWIERYLPAYREMFETAAAIVAVSRDMVEQLVHLGAPREKVTWNACGVDVDCFAGAVPAEAPPRFLAVGRFVEKKAPYLTLLAFATVRASCPEARLSMIGDGELLEPCRRMAHALGVDDAVDFPGVVSQMEIADALRTSRAYVQHSIRPDSGDSEGTPVSIMEAAASGLPVVSTRHGGIPDVVLDGESGFLVDEGDVAGMARDMLELAETPVLAGELGRRGRDHVCEHFAMDRSMARLGEIIERVTRNGGDGADGAAPG